PPAPFAVAWESPFFDYLRGPSCVLVDEPLDCSPGGVNAQEKAAGTVAGRSESSPLWCGLGDGLDDGSKYRANGQMHPAYHNAADAEHAALPRLIAAAPRPRAIPLLRLQPQPHQQQAGQRQDQQ